MKKMVSALIAVMMVFTFLNVTSALASGDGYYYGNVVGVVICTNISIREAPNTSAKRYGQLHNGDVVTIVGESNGWYYIDLASTGLKGVNGGIGYAKANLIKTTPYWIVLTKYTPVYADPWNYSGLNNGELDKGTPLLVLTENNEYYDCRIKDGQPGVTFVRKSDVGRFNPDCEPEYAVVVDGPVNIYNNSWASIGSLKTLDLVQVMSWGDGYSNILLKDGSTAWIETLHINPVIN